MYNINLSHPNQIRELSDWANSYLDKIENNLNIPCKDQLISLQLGNPQFNQADEITSSIAQTISSRPKNLGYDHHSGNQTIRKELAECLIEIYSIKNNLININPNNLILTNGATLGINACFKILDNKSEQQSVLLSKPGYPPYQAIAKLHNLSCEYYEVNQNNNFIPSVESLTEVITEKDPTRVKLIIFNYPHNPTGASLSKEKATELAETINQINQKFPWIIFIEESLYYATLKPNEEFWSIYSFLNDKSRNQTIIIGSGSKLGLAGERAGFIYSDNNEISKYLANYVSLSTAGTGYLAQSGLVEAYKLLKIKSGTTAITSEYREYLANFFQTRRNLINHKITKIANNYNLKLEEIFNIDQSGGMYAWINLGKLFKDKTIPKEISNYLNINSTYQTAKDLQLVLLHLPLIKRRPILIPTGDIFNSDNDFNIRISCANFDVSLYEDSFDSLVYLLKI
jgi:aspartate/methionine/tyrosine aminotransferase